jgi:hypothetical protein
MHNPKFLRQNCVFRKKYIIISQNHIKRKIMKLSNANLGLDSLIARVDEAFRVIVHNVSAALALTSAGH